MFLGHFGVGFGAKTLQPRVSLGTLFLAAQLADLGWPTLLLGIERVRIVPHITATNAFDFVYYPFTHSLVSELVAGLLLGLAYWLLRRNGRGAVLVGLLIPGLTHQITARVLGADLCLFRHCQGLYAQSPSRFFCHLA